MIYKLLTILLLSRLKVSIRIRVRFNIRYLVIGLDWVSKNGPMSNSEAESFPEFVY